MQAMTEEEVRRVSMMLAEAFLEERSGGGVETGRPHCDLLARIGHEDALVRMECERVASAGEVDPLELTEALRERAAADVAAAGAADPDGWYTAAVLKVHLIGDTVVTVEFALGVER